MERASVRVVFVPLLLAVLCLPPPESAAACAAQPPAPGSQQAPQESRPVLQQLILEGVTVYSRDDVLWLLDLREGAPLRDEADVVAKSLQDHYVRDGYTEARVESQLDAGRLTLRVDEGRIDEIELLGIEERQIAGFRDRLAIKPGDVYNKRAVGQAVAHLLARTEGAIKVGRPRAGQPGDLNHPSTPDEIALDHRAGRNVLVIPLQWRRSRTDVVSAGGREDFFSPVDSVSPALGAAVTIFDHGKFNHTLVEGYASYKFGPDTAGYSLGGERPLFGDPKLFLGAEVHDVTASDDLWRLSTTEQTLVSLGFKNSFRDYYRRRGAQVFGVFRAGPNNEFTVMARWDHHQPLANSTDFSFFRDDAVYRPNPLVLDQHVNAWVIGYIFDIRPLTGTGQRTTYARHLHDDLYGFGLRQKPGLRFEWSSELAGHGLGGDAHFDRHIFDTRGYLSFSERQLLSARSVFGFSDGTLPIERRFALGGIGTVHGYSFKEVSGTGMALMNAEYRIRLLKGSRADNDRLSVFGFYDAGRITGPLDNSSSDWLQGIGVGVGVAGIRVEFGFRANDIPGSRQILVRLGPTF
jgi:Omp85 superfamily domain